MDSIRKLITFAIIAARAECPAYASAESNPIVKISCGDDPQYRFEMSFDLTNKTGLWTGIGNGKYLDRGPYIITILKITDEKIAFSIQDRDNPGETNTLDRFSLVLSKYRPNVPPVMQNSSTQCRLLAKQF